MYDAHVICRMLNFSTAIVAFSNSAAADLYGTASSGSDFALDKLNCKGSEKSVFHCPIAEELTDDCEASQIAGVKCATSKICPISKNVCH